MFTSTPVSVCPSTSLHAIPHGHTCALVDLCVSGALAYTGAHPGCIEAYLGVHDHMSTPVHTNVSVYVFTWVHLSILTNVQM